LSDLLGSWDSFTEDDVSLPALAGYRGKALQIMETVNFDG